MTAWLTGLACSLAATFAGCLLIERWFPLRSHELRGYLVARSARMIGRAVIVLATIGLAIEAFLGPPVAVTLGALAGWVLAAGSEALRLQRADRTRG